MPPMNRGGFSNLIVPGYRKVVFETYKERPLEGAALVNMNSSKKAYEEDFPLAGFGTLQEKAEGGDVQFQDAIQGTVKRYIHSTYALGYRITVEMYDDDLYGIMGEKMAKALGRSARNNQEVIMHAPYNNAFSTSYPGFVASTALCGAHTLLRTGASVRNSPTTQADFSLLTMQAAIEHFDGLTDDSGFPIIFVPKLVVHSAGDQWIVNQVLKSANIPGSNVNDINVLASAGVKPHMSHYLTDSDAWFVVADQHDVNYFDRRTFTFTNADDFLTGDALFKGWARRSSGYGDWRGIYGSSGA